MPENGPSGDPSQRAAPTLSSVLTSETFARRDEQYEAAADKALMARPKFDIRMRLLLAFLLFFLLSLGTTLWAINILAEVEEKILFLEVADDYTAEIQQARRFEKTFLLYGTNLEDAREHTRAAQRLTAEHIDRFRKVVGVEALTTMNRHLAAYLDLLESLGTQEGPEYEDEIREHGGEMITLAQELVVKERARVHSMLTLARGVPFVLLGVLFAFLVLGFNFLYRPIRATLDRFVEYTKRIAAGDFSPITPAREYRDEFSTLALMINRMIRQLDRHQKILMESHKLRAVGTLVAGVAHELNNPMNNLLLTTSLLKEEYDALEDSERQEMLQDLVDQAQRSKNIVRNLLDFARESETTMEALDLRQIVEDTVRLVANQAKMKKVHLMMNLPNLLPTVHGDRQLLSQVFMNLIINAMEVLPERGKIRIISDTERKEGFLAIDVSDDGPGIPRHIMDRIFDPFFTTKSKSRGTGLGLSVSGGIVSKLGGEILVESQLGSGSTFTVLLPVTTVPSDVTSRPKEAGVSVENPAASGGN
jgi:signal transduction histidine kinase